MQITDGCVFARVSYVICFMLFDSARAVHVEIIMESAEFKFVIISDGSRTFERTRDIEQDDNTRCNSKVVLVKYPARNRRYSNHTHIVLNCFGLLSKYTGRVEKFTILGFCNDYFVHEYDFYFYF